MHGKRDSAIQEELTVLSDMGSKILCEVYLLHNKIFACYSIK